MATSDRVLTSLRTKFKMTECKLLAFCRLIKPLVEDTSDEIEISPPDVRDKDRDFDLFKESHGLSWRSGRPTSFSIYMDFVDLHKNYKTFEAAAF